MVDVVEHGLSIVWPSAVGMRDRRSWACIFNEESGFLMSWATRAASRPASPSFSERTNALLRFLEAVEHALKAPPGVNIVAADRSAPPECFRRDVARKGHEPVERPVTRRATSWPTSTRTTLRAPAESRILRLIACVAAFSSDASSTIATIVFGVAGTRLYAM